MADEPKYMESIRSALAPYRGQVLSHEVTNTFDVLFPSLLKAAMFVELIHESLKWQVVFLRLNERFPFTAEVVVTIPARADLLSSVDSEHNGLRER